MDSKGYMQYDFIYVIIWRRRQNYRDRNQLSGLEAGEGRALTSWENFLGWWKVLNLDCAYDYTILNFVKVHWIVYLRRIHFTLCKWYLNKHNFEQKEWKNSNPTLSPNNNTQKWSRRWKWHQHNYSNCRNLYYSPCI